MGNFKQAEPTMAPSHPTFLKHHTLLGVPDGNKAMEIRGMFQREQTNTIISFADQVELDAFVADVLAEWNNLGRPAYPGIVTTTGQYNYYQALMGGDHTLSGNAHLFDWSKDGIQEMPNYTVSPMKTGQIVVSCNGLGKPVHLEKAL